MSKNHTRNPAAVSRGTRRSVGRVIAVALVGSIVASGCLEVPSIRLSGDTRYETSAAAVAVYCAIECPAAVGVVITTGENFPDGLSAASLGEVVVTVRKDASEIDVRETIRNIESNGAVVVERITLIGGVNAVSLAVENELKKYATVVRLDGPDRYSTALAVAREVAQKPSFDGTAIIATGTNFPDALAAGPLSSCTTAPILLNNGTDLRPAVSTFLAENAVTKVYVVGGATVVPATIDTALAARNITVERLAGDGRAATAVAIAEEIADPSGCDLAPIGVVLVNGNTFADALSAGPLAAKANSPILLVNKDGIPAATMAYLEKFENVTGTSTPVVALGGTAVISQTVVDQADNLINGNSFSTTGPNILFATQSLMGTAELKVTTVFNTEVVDKPIIGLYENSAATSELGISSVPFSSTLRTDAATGLSILTNVYRSDIPGSLPPIGTTEVRVAVGNATEFDGGLSNTVVRTATIVPCAEPDALFRPCQALGLL